jgi:HSP20 family protein
MKGRKPSFLEHLTGTRTIVNDEHEDDDTMILRDERPRMIVPGNNDITEEIEPEEEEDEEEELPGLAVDMYEADNELVIQCMIAGVMPENLHISITRNTVTLEGKRNEPEGIRDEQYATRELYWGPFYREIELPHEIDPDGAEAVERYGLLIIRLPKFDTKRIQELKVKSV